MDIDAIRDYCAKKPGTEETLPFGPDVLVFKVNGKAYLLWSFDAEPPRFNVKCDPDKAEELRGEYPAVQPGWHMNKKHWNTVFIDGSIPNRLLKEWINHSYDLVSGANKKTKTKKK
jgi:predicted DNA-binding protein (MmcQ/YjbR family)